MTEAIPTTADEITPEWLNATLDDEVRGGATISGVEKEVIGAGVGFVGEITRLTLAYENGADGAPASIIAKWPTRDEAVRMLVQLINAYEREVRFYELLQDETPLRTPHCNWHYADGATATYGLLLEDLQGRQGDQLATCSVEEARTALVELAKFHAAWWGSPKLKTFAWMPGTDNEMLIGLLAMLYQQSYPVFVEHFGKEVAPEVVKLAEQFGQKLPELAAEANERALTLTHTDYRLDNMFFDLEDGSPVAVVDWQLAQRGPALSDVTYFLAGNLTTEARLKHQEELVAAYHEALVANGVDDITFESCWEEYRAAALLLFIFLVTSQENINLDNYPPRAQELFETITQRYTTAIMDLEAGEFMPA